MGLVKLIYSPEQAGYAVTSGIAVIAQKLNGGPARVRTDLLNPVSIVDVAWRLDRDEYTAFRAFYRGTIREGALPFTIDLIIDDSALIEHSARVMPGTMALVGQEGHTYIVGAQLEVTPLVVDVADAATIYNLITTYGSVAAAQAILLDIELFVNTNIPALTLSAYNINGISPVMVNDYARSFYFSDSAVNSFATHNISAATGTRVVTLPNGVLAWAGHNLILNSAVMVSQDIATETAEYTLGFIGTGTITLTGAASGVLAGTGTEDLVTLGVVAGVGALTLTTTGDVTLARCYRSDLGGMQTNDTTDPTYYLTGDSAYFAPALDYDPITAEALGVRIEPAAVNSLLHSDVFTNAVWQKTGSSVPAITVTPDFAVSPDGLLNATRLEIPENINRLFQNFNSATINTFSIWLKSNTGVDIPDVKLYLRESGFGTTYGIHTFTVTTEWQRFTLTADCSASILGVMVMLYNSSVGADDWDLLAYGAQVEVGSVATSYIPTGALAVTRNSDDLSMTTGVLPFVGYNQGEGTFVITSATKAISQNGTNISIGDGTAENRIVSLSGPVLHLFIMNAGTVITNLDAGEYANNVLSVLAFAYNTEDYAAVLDGGAVATGATGTHPQAFEMIVGADWTGNSGHLNGHIKSIVYYPVRLTDAQLVELSS